MVIFLVLSILQPQREVYLRPQVLQVSRKT